ncbi:MAG TPA: DMT family transporter [Candidatus Dormibacteraeota bacterium]
MARRDGPLVYVLLLVGVTAVWGWTFVLVKDAISQYPTLPFLAVRFALAFAVLALLGRRLPDLRTLKLGVVVGCALAAGYLLQTVGLQYTSPGNAGLITGLFVVFTPLIERVTGRPAGLRTYVAVVAALAGTALLAGGGSARIGVGDLLVVGCALAFAVHIVLLSHWSPGLPSGPLATVQMLTAAVLFTAGGAPSLRPIASLLVWFALVITGVFASALAFFIQTWAQVHLTASRTALILATEPAWALGFSVLLTGQRLDLVQGVGAALVLGAVIGHEFSAGRKPA